MKSKPANNAKKSSQLGMDFGTAMHQLRKGIVFRLLERLGENVCFRCNERIETANELSFDHKIDWLDVNPDLFWDLDNIAFSHKRCNRPGRPYAERLKKVGPEGTSWCSGHRDFLPVDSFGPKHGPGSRNGKQLYCRKCKRSSDRVGKARRKAHRDIAQPG